MRYKAKDKNRWHRWFALIPITIGKETIWLEWYWYRWCGDVTEVSLIEPQAPAYDEGETR